MTVFTAARSLARSGLPTTRRCLCLALCAVSSIALSSLTAQGRIRGMIEVGGPGSAGGVSFGSIKDVEVDDAGRIYVLDDRAREVVVLDSLGKLLGRIGGPGRGPGEFVGPDAVALAGTVCCSSLTGYCGE